MSCVDTPILKYGGLPCSSLAKRNKLNRNKALFLWLFQNKCPSPAVTAHWALQILKLSSLPRLPWKGSDPTIVALPWRESPSCRYSCSHESREDVFCILPCCTAGVNQPNKGCTINLPFLDQNCEQSDLHAVPRFQNGGQLLRTSDE